MIKDMNKLAVVAFGGNALLRSGQKGTVDEQERNVYESCKSLVSLIKEGKNLVIAHGNGPQVGNVLLQHEAGSKTFGIPKMPMDVCVAETQGSIGYLIEQQMYNVLREEGLDKNIVTLVTQVVVNKDDAAFEKPTKPVGPYYSEAEAYSMEHERGWKFQEDSAGRGWRRVVASPQPIDILNKNLVEKLAREGNILVTVGGGGIPVYYQKNGNLMGIDAVIDKDLASARLAGFIQADEFYILTDVPNVYVNFKKENEQKLEEVSVADMKKYLAEGQFAEGSMAPKIRAGISFAEQGGNTCITETTLLGKNYKGTIIHQ
jgi:carbamate kinase